ncbi:MAG: flagellar basal body P-ring formation protein FlgA, partial [Planctomycetes bacterium]|nr:flagellar basal body P-ring formation protein FlgA [Planctomycetota bacterium]
ALWREATVVDADVRIGDVCTLDGFEPGATERFREVRVLASPAVGESAGVSMQAIQKALAASGMNAATTVFKGATSCAVNRIAKKRNTESDRKGRGGKNHRQTEPRGRTLRDVIKDDLNEDAAYLGGWVKVVYGRAFASMLELREGEYEFEIQRTNAKRLGLISFDVYVHADGEQVQHASVVANVTFVKPTVVAARPINLSATIGPRDVKIVNMTYARFEQKGLDSLRAVVGQRAKRFIAAGQVVHDRNLEPIPLVKRGQIVEVRSRVGGVVIESVGRVMKAGAFGDVVELQTADRAKVKFTAIVSGPGLVSVGRLGGPTPDAATRLALGGEE